MPFLFFISLFTWTAVLGCGTIPQGQVTAVQFTTSDFTLPPIMVYSEDIGVQTRISSISKGRNAAKRFVEDLTMNAVNDVLQEQGRNALLPDPVVSLILQQLNVTIDYTALECKTATTDPMNAVGQNMAMPGGCFVISDMVTGLCKVAPCMYLPQFMNVDPVPSDFTKFTGTLKTSNIIMANWSKQMWQSVLNRVFQRVTSGQFQKYFSTATVTVNN